MSGPGFTRPDLCSICTAIEQGESANTVRGLLSTDGYLLADDNLLTPLARGVARTIVEAGFTSHHRHRYDPLYRLRGGQRTEAGR